MSELRIPLVDAKEIWRWQYANQCFNRCRDACQFIIKENLSDEHPAYYAISAGIHTTYARPFRKSFGLERIDKKIVPAELLQIHDFLMMGRDKLFAHLDTQDPFNWQEKGQVEVSILVHGGGHIEIQCIESTPQIPAFENILILVGFLCAETAEQVRQLLNRNLSGIPATPGRYKIEI